MKLVTLLTDFGNKDWFVGVLKGVLLSQNADLQIIDLTHSLRPFDREGAAFHLLATAPYFPHDTIHLVVVDPGVGSSRRPLLIQFPHAFFIGPDNGIFSPLLESEPQAKIYQLNKPEFFLPSVSQTFHGRDVFAPIASYLAKGIACEKLGTLISKKSLITLPWKKPLLKKHLIQGSVIYIDHFGNAITNIAKKDFPELKLSEWNLFLAHVPISRSVNHYAQAPKRTPCALWGSHGYLEFFLNQNPFARTFHIERNMPVFLKQRTLHSDSSSENTHQ